LFDFLLAVRSYDIGYFQASRLFRREAFFFGILVAMLCVLAFSIQWRQCALLRATFKVLKETLKYVALVGDGKSEYIRVDLDNFEVY